MSQHPADLKPRGVKAPLYLIPWDAAAGTCSVDQIMCEALVTLDPSEILCELGRRGVALEQVAEVFAYGARKYARDNWRTFTWDDSARDEYFGAICRHLLADSRGETIDPESGQPPLAHAACGALIWRWHELRIERQRADGWTPEPGEETAAPVPYVPRRGDRIEIPGVGPGAVTRDGWETAPKERGAVGLFWARADEHATEGIWAATDLMRPIGARPDV